MRKASTWVGIGIVAFVLITFLGIPPLAYKIYVEPAITVIQTENSLYLAPLLSDLNDVSKTYLMSAAADSKADLAAVGAGNRNKDAGPLLNPIVEWQQTKSAENKPPLAIPKEVGEWLGTAKEGQWIERHAEVNLKGLNFKWMQQLKDFEFWDIHSACDGCAGSGILEHGPLKYKNPDYLKLQQWAKLRFIMALQLGQSSGQSSRQSSGQNPEAVYQAATEVRDLARLIMSNETLVSAMVAQNIYKIERLVYDYLATHKNLPAPMAQDWKPLSLDQLAQAKRACWAVGTLFGSTNTADTLDAIYGSSKSSYCKCAGLAEGAGLGILIGKKIRSSLIENDRKMTELLQGASECRLREFRSLWSENHPELIKNFGGDLERLRFLPKIYSKLVLGLLLAGYQPNSWSMYKEK